MSKAKDSTNETTEKTAEALDKDNAIAPGAASAEGGDVVYVFANLPSGQNFKLPDGQVVTIDGMPVSNLLGVDGKPFFGGKYGVTVVDAGKWAVVKKIYGKMRMFQSGLVFDAPTEKAGLAMARERGGLRHGYEPIDPLTTKTKPNKED